MDSGKHLEPLPPLRIPGRRPTIEGWPDPTSLSSDADTVEGRSSLQKMASLFQSTEKTESTKKSGGKIKLIKQMSTERKISSEISASSSVPKEVKKEKPERARRESIKDHLLKFKMKAGKVLEDVHDRLVEEHSAASVAPVSPIKMPFPLPYRIPPNPFQLGNILSGPDADPNPDHPNPMLIGIQISPAARTSTMDMEEDSERAKSPSTISQSSKKTSLSAELKASLRTKIRKQAEKAVERTRGSVQLTRRLQRRLTIHQEEPSEIDLGNVDEQIEYSLKLGERFLSPERRSSGPTEEEQWEFATQVIPKENSPHIPESEWSFVSYRRAIMDLENHDANIYILSDADPESGLAGVVHPMRHSETVTSGQEIVAERSSRWSLTEEDAYYYLPARKVKELDSDRDTVEYTEINIELDSIFLMKHGLYTKEDELCVHLTSAYFRARQILYDFTVTFQTIQKNNYAERNTDDGASDLQRLKLALLDQIETVKKIGNELEMHRKEKGYAFTGVAYRAAEPNDALPFIGALTSKPNKTSGNINKETKALLEKRSKTGLRMCLFYNDITVSRTRTVSLSEACLLHFHSEFSIQVKSDPRSIFCVLEETEDGKEWKQLSKIHISIPNEDETTNSTIPYKTSDFSGVNIKEGQPTSEVRGQLLFKSSWGSERKIQKQERHVQANTTEVVPPEFHLIPPQCRLMSDEEFEQNIRWNLIQKREQKGLPAGLNNMRISLHDSEVDPGLLYDSVQQTQWNAPKSEVDGLRKTGVSYAAVVRNRLKTSRRDNQSQLQYEDVVNEVQLPTGGVFSLGSLFGEADISRKLKPMRRDGARTQISTDSRIVINCQSAVNLPLRKDKTLQPMVRAHFQRVSVDTIVVSGSNPNWQQSIELAIRMADLKTINEALVIAVYDQSVVRLDRDEREVNSVHEQLVRTLIGYVSIPFQTLLNKGKIDGNFRIETPTVLTNYILPERGCYIKLLIALDPPIQKPTVMQPELTGDSSENNKVLTKCSMWQKTCSTMFENRRYVALVSDPNGKKVLASRYIHAVRPPSIVEQAAGQKKCMDIVCRVVSAIPFVEESCGYNWGANVWTSMEHFISIGCGDVEEHAVLACCWLLSSNILAYVVLGSSLTEGDCASFVLAKSIEGNFLLDVVHGQVYAAEDASCPLISVSTVVSPQNIYGNIQQYQHPSQMVFDFTKASDWKPLFDKDQADIVQPATNVRYQELSEDAVMELRALIERDIKLNFDQARQYAIPQWNIMASRILREIVQHSDITSTLVDEKLARLRESYVVTATAWNKPYKSIEDCVQTVLSLDFHNNVDPSAQFAVAVQIRPYFGHIVSCSIAVAIMSLRK